MGIIVKVGQKWRPKDKNKSTHIYTITKIIGIDSYAIMDGASMEGIFGFLRDDGTPCGWDADWEVINEGEAKVAPAVEKKISKNWDEMKFFATVSSPENCPCNMPRSTCSFHK